MKPKEKLAELQASRQLALDAADVIATAGATDGLTAEKKTECDKLLADVAAIDAQITALVAEDKENADRAARLQALKSAPINAEVAAIVNRGPNVSGQPNGSQPTKWTLPASARRISKVTAFADDNVSGGFTAQEKAYRFGMFALAKAAKDLPGTYEFPRASRFCQDQGLWNAGHAEGASDTTGSHVFVPDEFGMDLIKLREEYGVARQLCKMRPMTSDTRTDPRWASGLTSYFTGEQAAGTVSTMQHDSVRLTAKKMTCLSYYSSELGEDAVIDLGNTLASETAYSDALKEDQCFVDGDGTSTYGGIRGLKAQFATTTLGTAPGFRDTTTSNTWAAIVIADLTTLISVVPVYAQKNMRFLCSSQFYYQVMVPLLNAAGGVTGSELQDGFRVPKFQGIPVMFSQVMGTATATSTIAVFLGDFSMGCSFGDRRRSTMEFTKEATIGGVSMFETDQIGVKSTQRIDINCHSVGSNSAAGPIVALSTGT